MSTTWRTIKTVIFIGAFFIALGAFPRGSVLGIPSGTWAPAASLAGARAGAASALLKDGRLIVTGGDRGGALASAELYDISTGDFVEAAPMLQPRRGHIAITLNDGRVLVAGGDSADGPLASAELYDPASDTWAAIADLADARSGATASLLSDGRVLIAGGANAEGPIASLELFDPTDGTFSYAGALVPARTEHAAVVLPDDRVLFIGGTDGTDVLSSVEVYDPETGGVTPGAPLVTPRKGHTATRLLDGSVIVIGGNDGQYDLMSAETYDPVSGVFAMTPATLAVPRRDHLAFLLPNNSAVLVVGGSSSGAAVSSAELYVPWAGQFRSTGWLDTPRTQATGWPLQSDGVLMVAGGRNASGTLGTAELYSFATVKTDKNDYSPGETVTFAGTGWEPGETVTLLLQESPAIHEDRTFTARADANGNFVNTDFQTAAFHFGVRFYLTATGERSEARTSFTDGLQFTVGMTPTTVSTGAPQTFTLTVQNLSAGTSLPLECVVVAIPSGAGTPASLSVVATDPGPQLRNWSVPTVSGGFITTKRIGPTTNGIDPPGTVAITFTTTATTAGTKTWTTTAYANTDCVSNVFPPPDLQPSVEVTAGTGTITIIKNAVPDDPQDFTFTTTGGLSPSSFTLDDDGGLGVGGTTFTNTQTFTGLSAGSYSITEGAMAGWDLTPLACVDPSGGTTIVGSTANVALAAGETVTCTYTNTKRATLIVKKQTLPAGAPETFAFSSTLGGLNGSIGDGFTLTEFNVLPGAYTVTEADPAGLGFDVSAIVCDDGSSATPSTGHVPSRTATFNADPGETITCTFTNTKRGTIIVAKETNPDGLPDLFTFTGSAAGSIADNGQITVANLVPGTYTSTEALGPAGFDLSSIVCSDGSSPTPSEPDLPTRTATFKLDPGETVTCTFTNTKRGTIIVEKQTDPDDAPGSFTFTGSAAGSIGDNGQIIVPNLVPGIYTSSEANPGPLGFDLTDIFCDDGGGPASASTGDIGSRTATFRLDAGETVTCVFVNTKRGSITVVKDAVPNDPQDFSFTGSGPLGTFALDDDSDPTLPSSRTFTNIVPGSYTLAEASLPNWDLTSLVCTDPDGGTVVGGATATIDIDPGESVTCTFTNTKRGSITIIKDTDPNDPQDFSFTATGGLTPFSLDDDADPTLPNTMVFPNVVPGAYSVTEGLLTGFDLTALSCTATGAGSSATGSTMTRTATIALGPGGAVTCTYVNTKRGSITIVKDSNPDDPQDFSFTGSGGLGTFSLDDDSDPTLLNSRTFTNVLPGSYTVSETGVTGFDLTALTCTPTGAGTTATGSVMTSTASITLGPGGTATCTYVNTKRGSITIIKDADPNDAQDFPFTSTGGLGSFTLDDDADPTLSNTKAFTNVVPGSYTFTEAAGTGFDLTALTCTASGTGTSTTTSIPTRTASVTLGAGGTVTCTYVNTAQGTITVTKDTVPDHAQDFHFTGSGPGGYSFGGGFFLDDDATADPTLPKTRTFNNLVPGTYTLTEDATSGFDLFNLSCTTSPGSSVMVDLIWRTVTITLAPAGAVDCTFENHQRGTLTIVKDAIPDDAQDFGFTGSGPSGFTFGGGFFLDDDANPTLANNTTFGNLLPGVYILNEAATPGFDTTVACSDGTTSSNATLSIDISPGEVTTCTYTNTKRGSITIVKDANPNDPQDFSFSGTGGLGSFSLDDDADPTLSNSVTFPNLVPGSYSVTEAAITGFDLTALSCVPTGGGTSATTDVGTRTSTIALGPGGSVTCTYVNTKRGNITIIKDANPNDPQDFSFSSTGGLGSFSLDDDSDPTLLNTASFLNLLPGSYSVTEAAVTGFDLTALTCTPTGAGTTAVGSTMTGTASITLGAGGSVTCTYVNTKRGNITIIKDTDPNDPQDFAFTTTGSGLSSFSLDDDSDPTLSNARTFANVLPGSYTVSETPLVGFDLTSLACTPTGSGTTATGSVMTGTATIALGAGGSVTCTYVNTKRGSITIVKDSNPDDPQDFAFTTTGSGLSSFSLDDDADPTLSNTRTFTNVLPGSYTVSETGVVGFDLTALTCTPTGAGTTAVGSTMTGTASITLGPGGSATCTYVNTKRGNITIVKDTNPDDPQDFGFTTTGSGLSSFSLDDDADPTLSNSRTFTNVLPGSYSVSETPLVGFDLTSLACTPTGSGTTATGSVMTGTASITLGAGGSVTCTYINTKRGSITIVKDSNPDDPQDFAYTTTGSGLSGFSLDDDADPTLSNTRIFNNVLPGSYSVTETGVVGFDLTALVCTPTGAGTTAVGSTMTGTASITLGAGGSATCTYVNTKRGSITIVKDSNPDDPQDFAFTTTGSGLSSFSLDDDADPTLSNTRIFNNVLPGSYSVTETGLVGFDLTALTCSPTGAGTSGVGNVMTGTASITLGAGGSVTCTFTNTKRGSITIIKDSNPDDPQDFAYTTTGSGLSSFSLDDDADPTLSNARIFNNVLPGSYSVTETGVVGFDLTALTCTPTGAGTTAVGSAMTGTASITLGPGGSATCTYVNTKRGSITIIKDSNPDDPQDFAFTTTGSGLSSFSLDDDADPTLSNTRIFNNVLPGSYSVAETGVVGFDLTALTCTPAGAGTSATGNVMTSTASITLGPGGSVSCTYVNTKRGSITIVKDADPNDPQDFSFTTTGVGLSSFSLDDDGDPTLSNTRTFNNVLPGSYSVTETGVVGFDLTALTCTPTGAGTSATGNLMTSTATITLGAGGSVTCTYLNTKRGSITIIKDTDPNDPQDFSFTGSDGLGTFSLDDDADPTLSNTRTFTNVLPGSYTVSEAAAVGFDLTSLTCSPTGAGTSGTGNLGTRTASLTLGPGGSVTCTYVNTKRGSITIIKDAVPNGPQDFSFSTTGGLGAFSLDDDADPTLSNTVTFANVVPGSYSVTEAAAAGFDLTTLSCTATGTGTTASGSVPARTATIALGAGGAVTCTYVNTAQGTIIIRKDTVPHHAQDFHYTGSGPGGYNFGGGFFLDDDAAGDPTQPNNRTFDNLVTGSYSVTEDGVIGFDLINLTCTTTPGSSATTNLSTGTVNISLAPAGVVDCTYQNRQRGTLTIVKDAIPDSPQDFGFTGSGPEGFTFGGGFFLDDDADPTLANTTTFGNLVPGVYILNEAAAAGFDTTVACSDGTTSSNATLSVDISAGEVVTCTYTNTKRGTIVIVKDSNPDDPQDFSFSSTGGLGSFSLDDDADPTLPNTLTFPNLVPGAYSVTEGALAGFDLTALSCVPSGAGTSVLGNLVTRTASITLAPAGVVTCTFVNTKRGSITIIKDANPNDPQDFSFTSTGGLGGFSLDDDSDPTLSNTATFLNLVPGAYSVTEAPAGGFDLTALTCTSTGAGTTAVGSTMTGTASITLGPGGATTCTYVNTKRGSITIIKDANPDDPQDFGFTASGGLGSFSLDDDSDPTLLNTRTFTGVLPGTYTITESAAPGFDLSALTCTTTGAGTTATGSVPTSTASVTLGAGGTATCTYVNSKRGSITIIKDADPNDPQDFSFTASGGLGTFSLDDDSDPTLLNTRTLNNVLPGSYTVSETPVAGFDLTSLTCTQSGAGTSASGSVGTATASITLGAGGTVTCTYVNTKRGNITIIKDANPDDPQDFSFTTTGVGLSSFSLDDDADPTLSNNRIFTSVVPGSYTVSETPVAGFDLTALTCTPTGTGTSATGNVGTSTASITLGPGGSVTCTYVNTKRGSITIVKDANPDDPQDFGFTTTGVGLSSFSLDDDSDPTLSNSRTFTNVLPGSYSVTETGVLGFDLTALTCSPTGAGTSAVGSVGTATASITLGAGGSVTCTYVNTKRGSITIIKDANPNDPQDFTFATTGAGLSGFSLDDDADPTLSNSVTFSNLVPGAFTVTEGTVVGFDLTALACTPTGVGTSATGSTMTGTASITLGAGGSVTCTYVNTKRGSITIVKDADPNDPQDFSFTTTGVGLSSFALDDDSDPTLGNTRTFNNVLPGSYTVTEAGIVGFDLTALTCTPTGAGTTATGSVGTSTASITLGAGGTATCTFVNTKRGSITIVKDANPDDPQDFGFTTTGVGLSGFSLDDDSDPTLSNSRTFTNVLPGSYSVTEGAVAGFDLTALTCTPSGVGTSASGSVGTATASITLGAGGTATCTFVNTKRGSITIVKDANPNDPQDFAFAGSVTLGAFSLDDDGDPTLSNTKIFNNVAPGSYTVNETAVAGFDLTALTCTQSGAGTSATGSVMTGTASITLGAGGNVTCTFVNTKRGSITIVKDANPNDPQDFSFTTAGAGLSGFSLDDDLDPTLSNSVTFSNLVPGAFTVTEGAVVGFDLTALTCTPIGVGTSATGSTMTGTASITLGPGGSVSCTYVNTKRGSITIVKDADPNDPQDFSFTGSDGLGTFSLDDDSDVTLSNTRIFNNVLPGSYTVSEAAVTGFDLTALTCTPSGAGTSASGNVGTSTASITLGAGGSATCTFVNTKRGTITIVKDANPDDPQDFSFSTTGVGLSGFSLDDDADPTLSNSRTFTNVLPGTYSVIEGAVTGFDLTALTCTPSGAGTSASGTVGTRTASITLGAGGSVTCTFVNTKRGSITIVKDADPNDPQDFTFTGSDGLGVFSLDDDSDPALSNTRTFTNVLPGSYTVSEATTVGFDLTALTCSPTGVGTSASGSVGTATATINLGAGGSATCTFVNTKRGSITIVKDANPNDPQDFTFTGSDGLGVFSLDDDADPTLSNSRTFLNVAPGTYTVSEAAVGGFDLTALTCSVSGTGTSASGNVGTATASITLGTAGSVTCSYVNTKRGSITIVKDATPNDPQDFSFTGSDGLGTFFLDDDSDPTLPNSQTFTNLLPGPYTVSEAAASGFDLTALTCTPSGAGTSASGSVGTRTATITLGAGGAVTCTYVNAKHGTITIVKQAHPNDPQDFAFTSTGGLGGFSLDDDADPTLSNTTTFSGVLPGVYSVTEGAVAGWNLTSVSCVDPDGGTTTVGSTAHIDLDAGESVTCTFVNTKAASVTIVKNTLGGDGTFGYSGTLGVTSLTTTGGTTSQVVPFINVPAGGISRTITESTLPSGWTFTNLACVDPDGGTTVAGDTATIDIDPGEAITCTYTNTGKATLVVRKVTQPGSVPPIFAFTSAVPGLSGTIGDGGTLTATDIAPGTYTVTETDPTGLGFDLTNIACSDGSSTIPSTGHIPSRTATFNAEAGETITCTFTNTQRGTIIVAKQTAPDSLPDLFTFTGDAAGAIADNGQITVANLAPGTYVSTEALLAGFDLTSIVCDDGTSSTPSTIDLSTRTATFKLDAGETITCTFTNTKRGTIIVEKQTDPDDAPGSFTFTGAATGSIGDNGQIVVPNLPPGIYTASEANPVPLGFDLSEIFCDDGSNGTPSTGDVGTRTATFHLDAGETVTCVFVNTKRGSITVVKDAVPDGPQDFSFSGSGPAGYNFGGGFLLDDDADGTLPNTRTFTGLVPGSYSLSEAAAAGFTTTVSCTGESPVSGGLATISVAAGEDVVCTFTNTQVANGTIIVRKTTTGGDGTFSFTAGSPLTPSSFSITTSGGSGPAQTFSSLSPGTYSVSETVPAGWSLSASCDDGSPVTAIGVSAGETVTCTFANTRVATITIVKDSLPNDPQDFSFTGSGAIGPFLLDDDSDPTLPNTRTFTVPTGGYTVAEAALTGFDLTALSCTASGAGTSASGNVGTRTATITLGSGGAVTCTFVNTKRGTIIVQKNTFGGNGTFSFTTGNLSPSSFTITTSGGSGPPRVFPNLLPANNYSVDEAVPAGWTLTGVSCSDGSSHFHIDLGPGETVTCTFTNTMMGGGSGGLVAAYGFNQGGGGTLPDSSGEGNNGTIVGATWTPAGKYGSALSFNGTTDYVSVLNSPTLTLTTAMTLEAWVSPNTLAGWQPILYKESPTWGLVYALYASDKSAPPSVYATTQSGSLQWVHALGPSMIPTGTWTHIAGTYDGANLRLYVNGVLVKTQARTGTIFSSPNPLYIGGKGSQFNGLIDEVRVYNRALSAAEINTDKNTPLP